MSVLETFLQFISDVKGTQWRLRKDPATGFVTPVIAMVDQHGNVRDEEGLLARALPVTNASAIQLVAAPAAGYRLRVHALFFGNVDSAVKVPAVRWGSGGADFVSVPVAANNGFQPVYYDPKFLPGPEATALYTRLSSGTANTNTVSVDALYTVAPI